jgi:hypothetical protein
VRGQHLLDRAKRFAIKLACNRVRPRRIGIDHSHQPHASRLLQLVVHASVIAPESANANHRNINRKFLTQISAPETKEYGVIVAVSDADRKAQNEKLPPLHSFFSSAICPA